MVGVSATVVLHRAANAFRYRVEVRDEFLGRFRSQVRMAFQSAIDVVYVCLVMLGVMDLHRARIDVRFQRVVSVIQGREFVCHNMIPFRLCCEKRFAD